MASVMALYRSRDIHKDDSNDDDIDRYIGLEVPQSIMQHKMKLKHKSEIHIIFNLTIECQQPTAIHEEVHTP
jgi:hypothetical protein